MSSAARIDVGSLIEGQGFGRFQAGLMCWICAFMFIEGYDMQVVGYAAPAIIKAWHSDKAAFGGVFGAGLGGFMLGATVLGNLGDAFGRKRRIVAVGLIFGLPESVRFLMLKRDRSDRVLELLHRARPELDLRGTALVMQEAQESGLPVKQLFAGGRASMTTLLWLAYAANMVSLH